MRRREFLQWLGVGVVATALPVPANTSPLPEPEIKQIISDLVMTQANADLDLLAVTRGGGLLTEEQSNLFVRKMGELPNLYEYTSK